MVTVLLAKTPERISVVNQFSYSVYSVLQQTPFLDSAISVSCTIYSVCFWCLVEELMGLVGSSDSLFFC